MRQKLPEALLSFVQRCRADHPAVEVEKVDRKKTRALALPASEAVWIMLNEVFPSGRTPQSSPSRYACLAGRVDTAWAIDGYLCV
jgi:hypothetical protein